MSFVRNTEYHSGRFQALWHCVKGLSHSSQKTPKPNVTLQPLPTPSQIWNPLRRDERRCAVVPGVFPSSLGIADQMIGLFVEIRQLFSNPDLLPLNGLGRDSEFAGDFDYFLSIH